jgi:hypothetical protein
MNKLKMNEEGILLEKFRKALKRAYPIVGPRRLNVPQNPTITAVRNEPKKISVFWLDCMGFSFRLSIEVTMVFSSFLSWILRIPVILICDYTSLRNPPWFADLA